LELRRLPDPQQLNLYDYTRNNPLKLIDPLGLDITVNGSEQDEYAKRLQSDVSFRIDFGKDIKIVIVDTNGKALDKDALKALGKTLKGAEKELFNAITDEKHHVAINAIDGSKDPSVFFGRSNGAEHTIAFGQAALLDQPKNAGGMTSTQLVGHETLEAYYESKGVTLVDAHNYANRFFAGFNADPVYHTQRVQGNMVLGLIGDSRIAGTRTTERITYEFVTPVPRADFDRGRGVPYRVYPIDVEKKP
jgi:hypothetical protein